MRRYLLILTALVLCIQGHAGATAYTWTGLTLHDSDPNNDSNSWDTSANWSPSGVPGAGDDVTINTTDQINSGAARQLRSLQFTSGVLVVPSLTTSVSGTWTGGQLSGIWQVPATTTLTISGSGQKVLDNGAAINNSGTVTWSGGLINAVCWSAISTINNESGGVFALAGDGTPFGSHYSYYVPVFNNKSGGQLIKSAGSGTTLFTVWTLNNAGAIKVNSGTLKFAANTTNFNAGSALSGVGTLHLATTATLNGTTTSSARVLMTEGSLTGSAGIYEGTGLFDWQGGILVGAITLNTGATMKLSDPAAVAVPKKLDNNAVLTNKGTMNWTGAGSIEAVAWSAISTINNESGATFNVMNDGTVFSRTNNYYDPVFNNKAGAVFAKTGGVAAANINTFVLNNFGTVRCDTGLFNYTGTVNLKGGGTLSGAGIHQWGASGQFNVEGLTTISGTLNWIGGTMTGAADGSGTLGTSGTGVFDWQAGRLTRKVTFAAASNFRLSGSGIKLLADTANLVNKGMVTWSGSGPIQNEGWANVSTIDNESAALWLIQGDASMTQLNPYYNGIFNNKLGATVQKSTTSGGTTLAAWGFNNNGLAQVNLGTLKLGAGGSGSGQFDCAAAGVAQFTGGTHALLGGTSFTGAGKVQIAGATVNASGTLTTSSTGGFEIVSGTLNGVGATGATLGGSGIIRWTGGTQGGLVKIPTGSTLFVSGTGDKITADNSVLTNNGTITWSAGKIKCNAWAALSTINNESGGVFNFAADGEPFGNVNAYYTPVFNNKAGAKLIKTAGSAATTCKVWTFNHSGLLQVNSGSVEFSGNAVNLLGGCTTSGAGTVRLTGKATVTQSGTMTAAARLLLDDATLTGAAAIYKGAGLFDWQGGTIAGSYTINAGANMAVSGTADKFLADAAVLNNSGTIKWNGGAPLKAVAWAAISTINNESGGVFNATSDGTPLSRHHVYYVPVFNNKAGAKLTKSAGAGTTQISTFTVNNGSLSGTTLTAGGELQCATGTMDFASVLNLYGGTFTGAGKTTLTGSTVVTGSTTIASTLVTLPSGELVGTAPTGVAAAAFATTGTGAFEWTGGSMRGAFNIAANSVCNINGAGIKSLKDAARFTNNGTVNFNAGTLQAEAWAAASAIVNASGATWNAAGGSVFNHYHPYYISTFTNLGTLKLGATGGAVAMGWKLVQGVAGTLHSTINSATDYGRISAASGVTLNGGLTGTVQTGYVPPVATRFILIACPALSVGSFTGLPEGAAFPLGGRGFRISYVGNDGNDVVLSALPGIGISDAPAKLEGHTGTVNAVFTVTLSPASTQPVSVAYSTAPGPSPSATSGTDFQATSSSFTFAAGETSKTINVPIIGDYTIETTEYFVVNLSAPTNGVLLDSQGLGTITDDDTQTLLLSLSAPTVTEGGAAATATLTRNAALANALTVTLSSSPAGQVTIPATVTIPAGAASTTFSVTAVNDTFVDGNVSATLTSAAAGWVSGTKTIMVNDNDVPTLSVTTSAATLLEGGASTTGTVTRNTPTTAALTVTLSSAPAGEVTIPTSLVIPAGSAAATFTVAPVNDTRDDGNIAVTITAAATGFVAGTKVITVNDNDVPTLSLTTSATVVTEGGAAITGTVTRNTPTTAALVVTLSSSVAGQVTIPATVTIPVGAASVNFAIAALNDALADGNLTVTLTAAATGYTAGTKAIVVNDNDKGALRLSITPNLFSEAAGASAAIGTVKRNTATTAALLVTLTNSAPSAATVPATVTIPAGAASVTFVVAAVNDTLYDGDQATIITAVATGLIAARAGVTVIDDEIEEFLTAALARSRPLRALNVQLSQASLSGDTVELVFTGMLSDAARDSANYLVAVNGLPVSVFEVQLVEQGSGVLLHLPQGTLQSGDAVQVFWRNLATNGNASDVLTAG